MRTAIALALVAVVAASRGASSEPTRSKALKDCHAEGRIVLSIDSRSDSRMASTSRTMLFASHFWSTTIRDPWGEISSTETGCLSDSEMQSIVDEFTRTPWRISRHKTDCQPSTRVTVYRWNKSAKSFVTYAERQCSGTSIDRDTRVALDHAEILLRVPEDLDRSTPECATNPLAAGCR
jgi:hypothetical protein